MTFFWFLFYVAYELPTLNFREANGWVVTLGLCIFMDLLGSGISIRWTKENEKCEKEK